jgi:hypothetical protein
MLSQALLQRREWSKEYGLSNKVLYELFSEFRSMMSIGRVEETAFENTQVEGEPEKDLLSAIIKVDGSEKMSSLNKKKILAKIHNHGADTSYIKKSKHPNGLDINVNIFKKYYKLLASLKPSLVDKFLQSLGVEVSQSKSRVSWEIFLQINCLMNFGSSSLDQYITFFAGIFDPFKHGRIRKEDYEYSIDCLFKDQFSDGFEDEKNSLSADVKRLFTEQGIVDE